MKVGSAYSHRHCVPGVLRTTPGPRGPCSRRLSCHSCISFPVSVPSIGSNDTDRRHAGTQFPRELRTTPGAGVTVDRSVVLSRSGPASGLPSHRTTSTPGWPCLFFAESCLRCDHGCVRLGDHRATAAGTALRSRVGRRRRLRRRGPWPPARTARSGSRTWARRSGGSSVTVFEQLERGDVV